MPGCGRTFARLFAILAVFSCTFTTKYSEEVPHIGADIVPMSFRGIIPFGDAVRPAASPPERIRSSKINKKVRKFGWLALVETVSAERSVYEDLSPPDTLPGGVVCFVKKQPRAGSSCPQMDLIMKKPSKRIRGSRGSCLFLFFPKNKQLAEAVFLRDHRPFHFQQPSLGLQPLLSSARYVRQALHGFTLSDGDCE
jgi:hypothetical protein